MQHSASDIQPLEARADVAIAATALPPSSQDALWQGRLWLRQPARNTGYRFNLDSVLLAGFVAPQQSAVSAIDLGAGCGIISALLLACGKASVVQAVERQPALAAFARDNAQQNGMADVLQVLCCDLREAPLPTCDLVVFNPPYFAVGTGHAGVCPGRDAARREVHGTLKDFVAAAARALRPGGRVCAIVPYDRRVELARLMDAAGLPASRRRVVRAHADRAPRHLLLEAQKSAAGVCLELPPLCVHEPDDGRYTPEVEALVRGPQRLHFVPKAPPAQPERDGASAAL